MPITLLILRMNATTLNQRLAPDTQTLPRPAPLTRELIAQRVDELASMPSLDAILQPLLAYLQQPFEQQDVQRIVDLISHDNSLAAQCLHMANSPLYGRWQSIASVRAAVVALGLQRMRDIALSCCVLKLIPSGQDATNPVIFWEHSLACALLARKLAKRIGVSDPEQAYLAGLLHDIGLIVNLRLFPAEFGEALRTASSDAAALHCVEDRLWNCNHSDTGSMLAAKWTLTPVVTEVIQYHHRRSQFAVYRPMIALVSLCDQICRANGLGYGYQERIVLCWDDNELLDAIRAEWPVARTLSWAQTNAELVSYLNDVRKLVTVLFRLR
ncbi:MAG: HDOD domain-containing protein [Terriglobales bacterium]